MKYGFIGCGNMGGALARALLKCTNDVIIADPSPAAKAFASEVGCAYGSNEDVSQCDRIFLAVKPHIVEGVLTQLRPVLAQRKPLLISMAAGVKIEKLQAWADTQLPIVRIMPNTPAAVGMGMITYDTNGAVSDALLQDFLSDMRHAGTFDPLPETLMDAATAVAGCGPAYMYMMIEAMADGGVVCGLPRDKAMQYAAATMAGAAQMVLQSHQHPGALKDAVCSPGGSTIVGVQTLEQNGFRGSVMDCVVNAYRRTQGLG